VGDPPVDHIKNIVPLANSEHRSEVPTSEEDHRPYSPVREKILLESTQDKSTFIIDDTEQKRIKDQQQVPIVQRNRLSTYEKGDEESVYVPTKKKTKTENSVSRMGMRIRLNISGKMMTEVYSVLERFTFFNDIISTIETDELKNIIIPVDRNPEWVKMSFDIARNNIYVKPDTKIKREFIYQECKFLGLNEHLFQMCPANPIFRSSYEFETTNSDLFSCCKYGSSLKISWNVSSEYQDSMGLEFRVYNPTAFVMDLYVTEQRRNMETVLGTSIIERTSSTYQDPSVFRTKTDGIGRSNNLPSVLILEFKPQPFVRTDLCTVRGSTTNSVIFTTRNEYRPRPQKVQSKGSRDPSVLYGNDKTPRIVIVDVIRINIE
jgi:hypothetical protein